MYEVKRSIYLNANDWCEYFQYGENITTIDRKRNKKIFCVSTDKAANPVNMMGFQSELWKCIWCEKSEQITIFRLLDLRMWLFRRFFIAWFQPKYFKEATYCSPMILNDISVTQRIGEFVWCHILEKIGIFSFLN
jgi:hypothetical protein